MLILDLWYFILNYKKKRCIENKFNWKCKKNKAQFLLGCVKKRILRTNSIGSDKKKKKKI